MEATFGFHPLPGASSCALAGDSGLWWSPGVPRLHPLTCGSSCFAGAAGCVATLLHDAAMNPAEGNDGPGLPGRGGSGAQGLPGPLGSPLGHRGCSPRCSPDRKDPLGASGCSSG